MLTTTSPTELYLNLLKLCLTRLLFVERSAVSRPVPRLMELEEHRAISPRRKLSDALAGRFGGFARLRYFIWRSLIYKPRATFDVAERVDGRDWPKDGETMIGLARLDNLQFCIEDILRNQVSGDVIETGVWRGGASIFMRGVLKAHGDTSRTVWVADSFAGLPKPDARRSPADAGDVHWTATDLAVSLEQVKANFARYDLLDERVRFLVGWFSDTLPEAPIERLSLIRLDGDMYKSTMDALDALYHKLSPGGYCVVDDYGAIPACRKAVDEFRARIGETAEMTVIDWSGVYWKKSAG